jgi:UDP-glucose 4-epimerase
MILVSGGAGYIGSNTIIALSEMGFDNILSVDNFMNSNADSYERLSQIIGKKIASVECDLANREACLALFDAYEIEGIIHFAALKSVPESVEKPNLYFRNNLNSLNNLLEACKLKQINKFIFSSSCTVYGSPEELPVSEKSPLAQAESPYGLTKQMGEMMIENFCKINPHFKAISLRYFNPAGAHESGKIGETITDRPSSLVPILAQQAAGIRDKITVFGDDYQTPDGSCIRDYIHVSDIAEAHVMAYEFLSRMDVNYEVFNLGSGDGNSTLEVVKTFENENQLKLNYEIGPRRAGDVEKIFASNAKARKLLGWQPKRDLKAIVSSAWKWQKNSPDANQ